MLGLRLNHASKRDHKWVGATLCQSYWLHCSHRICGFGYITNVREWFVGHSAISPWYYQQTISVLLCHIHGIKAQHCGISIVNALEIPHSLSKLCIRSETQGSLTRHSLITLWTQTSSLSHPINCTRYFYIPRPLCVCFFTESTEP